MKKIETSITIKASVEEVWQVLTDFKAYPLWSPTIKYFEGQPVEGKRCAVLLEPPDGFKIKMNPRFLSINPNCELRWKGELFIPGIFDGEHYFILEQAGEGEVRFIQGELFSGLLIPFCKKLLLTTSHGFDLFNKAIKQYVEQKD
ncbi:SRPBCC domain-containing protein [Sphingobacterium sp.]|uniref:SRPBCC domain-containing protein n=1 Tax=Sphingobacterium sp. TaxID=341027 RepID=UPI0031D21C77